TVGTNNATGYKTIMTSSSGNTDLVETTDNTLTIPTLASGSYSSPSDFPANHWGYKKDSGSYIPFAINTTILESDTYANDDTTTLSFATKIDYLQASGTYKTTLVFTTTANPGVDYMQTFTYVEAMAMSTNETKTLVDKRDNQAYTVAKLSDGNVWMTRNLAIGCNGSGSSYGSGYSVKNLVPSTSNVNGSSYTTPNTSLVTGNSYNDAYQTCDPMYGAWYNYAAASAGAITGSSDIAPAVSDICPKGWRLPTYTEASNLISAIGSSPSSFNPNLGGMYVSGSISYASQYGFFYTSDAASGTQRYNYRYDGSTMIMEQNTATKAAGFYIRCIKDSQMELQNINTTTLDSYIPNAGNSIVLTDNRDGQKYTVAKLLDGNIWMGALNLGAIPLTQDLTSSNTNLSTTISANDFNNWDITNVGGSNTYSNGEFMKRTGADTVNSSAPYGTIYNYCATSAGTICSNSNTADAIYDICPAGWRLPTGGTNGEMTKLNTQYGYNSIAKMVGSLVSGGAGFPQSVGVFQTGGLQNGCSHYYSSTYINATTVYGVRLYGDWQAINWSFDRGNGIGIRCIKK
ncbi:hypothetical protein IJG92_02730, partial [Candidatus Saccharibacteria bacterium]|nr:hypothetical protein [Candidatus Saccharibacteria bacterium]